jgi:hypothetical protein
MPSSKRWVAWLLGFSFIPVLQALDVGQISPLILLGVTGFLYFTHSCRWTLAGCCTVLISIKPQLLYLFWPILILWDFRGKHSKVLILRSLLGRDEYWL